MFQEDSKRVQENKLGFRKNQKGYKGPKVSKGFIKFCYGCVVN